MYNREGCDAGRLLVFLQCEGSQQTEIVMRETGGHRVYSWQRAQLSIKKPVGSKCTVRYFRISNIIKINIELKAKFV